MILQGDKDANCLPLHLICWPSVSLWDLHEWELVNDLTSELLISSFSLDAEFASFSASASLQTQMEDFTCDVGVM